jgi:hypothetical protein
VKKLAMLLLLTSSVQAAELPQYEVSGFPVTPVQTSVTGATAHMREMMPTAPGLSPVQSLLLELRRVHVPPVQARIYEGEVK